MSDKPVNQIVSRMIQSEGFDGYYALPKHIQRSTHFVSKVTGESVELSQADKSVLYYFIEKIGFHNGGERQMFESMVHIAYELCVSDKTVSRSVKKLIQHEVLIGSVVSKSVGYVYTDVDVNQTFIKTVSSDQQKKLKPNPMNVQAPVEPVETIADTNPDAGMPEWMQAPEFDYSDVLSHMANSDYEQRVGTDMVIAE